MKKRKTTITKVSKIGQLGIIFENPVEPVDDFKKSTEVGEEALKQSE
jgi:hypothetical protein